MEDIRQYLLSVTAAAIMCGLLEKLLVQKGTAAAMGKMLAGIFLAVTIISPAVRLNFDGWMNGAGSFSEDASAAVQEGKELSNDALRELIKDQTQAYILDKAKALHADLKVQVEVSDREMPVPVRVKLEGEISPYAKQQLQSIITQQLGIAKEDQIWK